MRKKAAYLSIALTVALSGCASFAPQPPEKVVESRAMQYWQSRLEGKLDKAYTYATPGFRAARTVEQYKSRFGSSALIKEVEVYKVTCEPLKCVARMQLTAQLNLPMLNLGNMKTYVDEVWVLEDGSWWRFEEL
jgi:hypothetical protein